VTENLPLKKDSDQEPKLSWPPHGLETAEAYRDRRGPVDTLESHQVRITGQTKDPQFLTASTIEAVERAGPFP